MNEDASNSPRRVHDRALLLHGAKRNEVLSLAEIEQYGLDSFAFLGQRIELVYGDYAKLLREGRVAEDRDIVVFVAPPWGTALDQAQGLDLSCTTPPVADVVERIAHQFPKHKMLFATQVYEKLSAPSLGHLQTRFDWSELRI